MLEIVVPAKYQSEIDHLVGGFGGLHGLHHRLAWAIMPQCIRDLVLAGLKVALAALTLGVFLAACVYVSNRRGMGGEGR